MIRLLAINLPNLDLSYFKNRGLEFEVKHINLDLKPPLKWLYNFNGQDFHTPDLHDILNTQFPKFEQMYILYGYSSNNPKNSTGGYAFFNPLKSGSFWASIRKDGNENKYAVHELHHLLCHTINLRLKDITPKDFMDSTPVGNPPIWANYYLNDQPENPQSNHSRTWANIIPFLPKLKAIKYETGYKYFNPKSDPKMIGIKHETMLKLDELRDKCGFPISITSGLRSKDQNDALKGSASNSGHLRGYEVDIACTDGFRRDKIIRLSYEVGFTRRGIGKDFIHLGIDPELPNQVMWTYYD